MQFDTAYSQLNEDQRKAVDTIEGPVMVLAGPGTGKTQVLALRIANILRQTDTPPQSILALTFTEAAAANMRQRLVSLIGSAGYYVQISTFHSFCSGVIQHHPEYFSLERSSQPLTEVEKFQLFEQLLSQTPLDALKPLNRPLFYLREVMRAISDLKREGVSPEGFTQIVDKEEELFAASQSELTKGQRVKQEKMLARWSELVTVYKLYQDQLQQRKRYDFDDMIMFTKTAFEEQPDLLLEYQEQLHYFLVDEYQDTNSAQNSVVALLASFWGEQANLFVVGDPHQAIYRFQGASVENALNFATAYPHAVVINLQVGYRCPQLIYDAAHQLISYNKLESSIASELVDAVSQKLVAANAASPTAKPAVSITTVPNQVLELVHVAQQVQSLIKTGVSPAQIAVLFRHNKDSQPIQELFAAAGIPFSLAEGKNALHSPLIQHLILLLSLMKSLDQGEILDTFYDVLQLEWFGLSPEIPFQLAVEAHQAKKSVWQVAAESDLDANPSWAAAKQIQELLLSWLQLAHNEVLPVVLQTIFEQSGISKWIKEQPAYFELLQQLTTFFEYAQQLAFAHHSFSISELLSQLEVMQQQGISMPLEQLDAGEEGVVLGTAHKAKGQEWDYVFIVHAIDGKWGNTKQRNVLPLPNGIISQPIGEEDTQQDDRRLFYVALTRARKQVTALIPEVLTNDGRQQTTVPSIFTHEIQGANVASKIDFRVAEPLDSELITSLEQKLQPAKPSITKDEKVLLHSLVQKLTLSATGLNTYLQDPEKFLEQVVLRVPRAKAEPLAFGTAMHSALEFLAKSAQTSGQLPSIELVSARFTAALNQELLSEAQMSRRLRHGVELVQGYYAYLQQEVVFDPTKIVFIERFLGSSKQPVYLDDIPLVGRIDRVDWIDQQQGLVRVIDYKTGKPKSDNQINGAVASQSLSERERSLPESIRGPLKRQLLFYKLLADLDPTFKPTVVEGIFSFIEPSPSGKIVDRHFALLDEDVEDLKDLIKEVMSEIRQLQFLGF